MTDILAADLAVVVSLAHHPLMHAALAGAIAAAGTDLLAFRSWQSWHEFATYHWSVATFRWFQGAVTGALAFAGLGAVLS